MNAISLAPVALDIDGSFDRQVDLKTRMCALIDLKRFAQSARLSTDEPTFSRVRDEVQRAIAGRPTLAFIGSGDFHHLSLALTPRDPSAPPPPALVLIDNHPDWFCQRPPFHCGNWVGTALRHGYISSAHLIGQSSDDLKGRKFLAAPLNELADGRLRIVPLSRRSARVPFRRIVGERAVRHWWGSTLAFDTLRARGIESVCHEIADSLGGRDVYLSVDKDVLAPRFAVTDWEQGDLSLNDLCAAVRIFASRCRVIGADVCGERSPQPLRGLWKRLDAGRWTRPSDNLTPEMSSLNERANVHLLDAFLGRPV